MKRLVIVAVIAGAVIVMMKKKSGMTNPEMRARCSEMCDRMLGQMPDSFPPKRMMSDLESLKEDTARILDLLEDQTES